jgi:hypothetical protein
MGTNGVDEKLPYILKKKAALYFPARWLNNSVAYR